MPVFEIEKDGKTYEVDAPSQDEALKALEPQQDIPQVSPPPERGFGDKAKDFGLGVVRGLRDVPDAGAQLVTRGIEMAAKYAAPESDFAKWIESERQRVEGINREAEREYQEEWRTGEGIDPGRIAGNILGTAPLAYAIPGAAAPSLMGRMAAGAGAGATAGAAQPVYEGDFWKEKGLQTALGAGAGGVAPAVTAGVARVVKPATSAAVSKLREMGVSPTIGQTLGGAAKRAEEAATSIPVVGDIIRSAQRRSVLQYNRGLLNETLKPIGKKLPKSMPVNRAAIDYVGRQVSKAYDDAIPDGMIARLDSQFLDDVANLRDLATNMLPQRAKQFENILREQLVRKVSNNGTVTGQTFKEAESELGRMAARYGKSPSGDERLLGDALKEAQNILRGLAERQSPKAAKAIKAANAAYAKLLRVENAATRAGSKEGVSSPAAFRSAVRAMDQSGRKRATARGKALMQDVAEAGENVLGPSVPDSGTPLRSMVGLGALGGLGYVDPMSAAVVGTGLLPYAPGAQRLVSGLLTNRPAGATALARGIRAAGPAAAAGAGSVAGGNIEGLLRLMNRLQ